MLIHAHAHIHAYTLKYTHALDNKRMTSACMYTHVCPHMHQHTQASAGVRLADVQLEQFDLGDYPIKISGIKALQTQQVVKRW